jgi:hypothetical protein
MNGTADLTVNSRLIASFHFHDKAGQAWALERLRWIVKMDVLSTQDWEISLTLQSRNDHAIRQWKTDTNNRISGTSTGLQHVDQVSAFDELSNKKEVSIMT